MARTEEEDLRRSESMCEPRKPFAPVNRTRFAITKVGSRKGILTYETVKNDFLMSWGYWTFKYKILHAAC